MRVREPNAQPARASPPDRPAKDEPELSTALLVDRPDVEANHRLRYLTWVGLLALLGIEIVAVTLRFDGKTLHGRDGWTVGLMARAHLPVYVGICIVVGSLFGAMHDRQALRRMATTSGGRRAWAYLLAHLGAYGGFVGLTGWIYEGSALASKPLESVALWLAAGLATLGLWMLAALPPAGWLRLARTRWQVLLVLGLAGIAALVAGRWTASYWETFRAATFRAVRDILALFYGDVICRPETFVLGTPRFRVQISHQCSGFEGIGLIWALLGAYLWWFRRDLRFPQVLLLIPLGTAMSWSFNVLRISALIALGDHGWRSIAAGGFHSQAGWLTFNIIGLGLIAISRRMPIFSTSEPAEPATTTDSTAAHVAPLLAVALAATITGALSDGGFDQLYVVRVAAGVAVLWSLRGHYGVLRGWCSWQALAIGTAVFAIWTALDAPGSSTRSATAMHAGLAAMPKLWAMSWLVVRGPAR